MKLKFNTFTILLAAVTTIIILGVIINKSQLSSSQKVVIEDNFSFDKISTEKVEKIEIIKLDEEITLTKTEGIWKIGEKDADDLAINSLITLMNEAKADQLVSTKSENHDKFGVDDGKGTLLKFYKSGDNLIEQVIFGTYVSGGKIYGRKLDGNNVYTINANIFSVINQVSNKWEKIIEEPSIEDSTIE